MPRNPSNPIPDKTVSIIAMTGSVLFILSFLGPSLLLTDTTATGGDTASHVMTALIFKNRFLPSGQVSGWMMGNLGGFPLLQNYFFLPFLLTALLSCIVPFHAAFKAVAVSGVLLLPLSVHFFFKKLAQPFPRPEAAAVLTLPFLFMESQTIWGGNIASCLSGTFSYSLGLCFTMVFLGLLFEHFTLKKQPVLCPVFLALTGFCHGYTLLFSGFASLFFLFMGKKFLSNFKELFLINGTAACLMAFWLFPLIGNLPYTTPFGFVWDFVSAKGFVSQVFPRVMAPFAAAGLLGLFVSAIINFSGKKIGSPVHSARSFIFFTVITGFALYSAGAELKLVDIRFLPFFQLFAVTAAALFIPLPRRSGRATSFLLVFFTAAVMLWVEGHETYVRSWAVHNNRGFENTLLWEDFEKIMERLKGTVNDPRVAYENSTIYERAGTLRAMESLPYFSGRSTLEGVYIQGSILSPAIYALQAEISEHPSLPLVEYSYPSFDLRAAASHLRLFNAGQVIFAERKSRAAAWASPDFTPLFRQGPFEVFQVNGNTGSYVEYLKYKPALLQDKSFRKPFYSWFLKGDRDVFLVFDKTAGPVEKERFVLSGKDGQVVGHIPLPPIVTPVKSRVREGEILISDAQPGRPLLVKVSYHPGWKAEGGEKIYPVSPGFMLVYPENKTVRLHYGPTSWDRWGAAFSIFGIALLGFHILKTRKGLFRPWEERSHE